MNVTVVIPPALASAVEGRDRLELGVPPSADLGDVLMTLLTLYPRLKALVASDRPGPAAGVCLWAAGADGGASRLTEGQTLYLVGSTTKGPAPVS